MNEALCSAGSDHDRTVVEWQTLLKWNSLWPERQAGTWQTMAPQSDEGQEVIYYSGLGVRGGHQHVAASLVSEGIVALDHSETHQNIHTPTKPNLPPSTWVEECCHPPSAKRSGVKTSQSAWFEDEQPRARAAEEERPQSKPLRSYSLKRAPAGANLVHTGA